MMDYLKKGLQHTLHSSRLHPLLLLVLMAMQLAYLLLFSVVAVNYQLALLQDAQSIIQPLQQADYDPNSLQEGKPFTTDTLQLYRSYRSLIHHLQSLILWVVGLFLFLNGALWIWSHQLLYPARKPQRVLLARRAVKYFFCAGMLSALLALAGYVLHRTVALEQTAADPVGKALQWFFVLFLALYYGFLVSAAFIDVMTWKQFGKVVTGVGMAKIHWTMLVAVVNIILLAVPVIGMYYAMDAWQNFPLLVLLGVLFIVLLVFTRLFWISALHELVPQKKGLAWHTSS